MKKILSIFCLSLWCMVAIAQHELHKQYHVYLNDGSFLKGELIVEDENSIQLKLINQEIVTLQLEIIDKMLVDKKTQTLLPKGISIQESGSYNIIAFGILAGQQAGDFGDNTIGASALTYIRGHQWNKHVAFGAGISFDLYDEGFMPIYADFRGYLLHKQVSLFYALDVGYAMAFDQFSKKGDGTFFKGGFMMHPSLGVRLATKYNYSFLFEMGYRFQYAKRETTWGDWVDEIVYKRLALRVGMVF